MLNISFVVSWETAIQLKRETETLENTKSHGFVKIVYDAPILWLGHKQQSLLLSSWCKPAFCQTYTEIDKEDHTTEKSRIPS